MKGQIVAATVASALCVAGLSASTQTIAAIFADQAALGRPLLRVGDRAVYWPWSVMTWSRRWRESYPRPFALAHLIVLGAVVASAAAGALLLSGGPPRLRRHGGDGWASFEEAREAGLFSTSGVEGDVDDRGFGRSVGDAAAQEAVRTGGRIIDRDLQTHPTLRVRAGAPVRVLVTRDLSLRPYP